MLSTVGERPIANAVFLETVPVVDGEVLNDEVWQAIEPFGDLTQAQPNFGRAASEKTEIRIAYTKETFAMTRDLTPLLFPMPDVMLIWTIQMPFFLFWIPIRMGRMVLSSERTL